MDDTTVAADNSNTAKEVTPEVTSETTEETPEELKAKLTKAEELANNYKVRAEKAEEKAKKAKSSSNETGDLSSKDIFALTKANIHEEDLDEIVEYSRFKKIGVAEALKTSHVKTMLADKDEQRKVASATNTGSSKRNVHTPSDDEVLSKARKGEVADSDDDIDKLTSARINARKKKS